MFGDQLTIKKSQAQNSTYSSFLNYTVHVKGNSIWFLFQLYVGDIDCKETLLEFSRMSKDSKHDLPNYEAFRNVLRKELEKHKNESNYGQFEWQITDRL